MQEDAAPAGRPVQKLSLIHICTAGHRISSYAPRSIATAVRAADAASGQYRREMEGAGGIAVFAEASCVRHCARGWVSFLSARKKLSPFLLLAAGRCGKQASGMDACP